MENRAEWRLGAENMLDGLCEEWIKCDVAKSDTSFIVTSLIQGFDSTRIILDDEKKIVEIIFEGYPPVLRSTDEGIRMRTWNEVQEKYKDKAYFRGCFLYYVQNSKLIEWAVEESCGFYEKDRLKHYCVVTSTDLIDVLTGVEPKIVVKEVGA